MWEVYDKRRCGLQEFGSIVGQLVEGGLGEVRALHASTRLRIEPANLLEGVDEMWCCPDAGSPSLIPLVSSLAGGAS